MSLCKYCQYDSPGVVFGKLRRILVDIKNNARLLGEEEYGISAEIIELCDEGTASFPSFYVNKEGRAANEAETTLALQTFLKRRSDDGGR
jgi:hypothetical protein